MNPNAVSHILESLERAWNDGDGAAFAAPFAPNATFVTVNGQLIDGPQIGPGHQHIFDTIYRNSTVSYSLRRTTSLAPDVVLVHVDGKLSIPTGPRAGNTEALMTMLFVNNGTWHIASFHNTLVNDEFRKIEEHS